MMATRNLVRRGFYADSVALMRIARELESAPGVMRASLMIGTPSNKALLKESGLLSKAGESAQPDDLIIAVKGKNAEAGLVLAEKLLTSGTAKSESSESHSTFASALGALPGANLALISVPGEFAAAEARRALERGLHAMVFSDNVPLAEEVALKDFAAKRGLLMMGPDCGTALIAGTPLAFANAVPRGAIGIVSASGTGLQEVSTLLARAGHGVSHGIGVGGRDLSAAVGGRMTLAALDALEADPATKRIIVISKPPAPSVTAKILARAKRCRKPVTLCLLGAKAGPNIVRTLEAAAGLIGEGSFSKVSSVVLKNKNKHISMLGLFCGGTLCAEAQVVLMDHGLKVASNAPVPGARESGAPHRLIDLGADEFTRGRPHPMIEPALRNEHLARALRDKTVGVVLLDVVIGYGAHADPAGLIADVVRKSGKLVIASVTGTEDDPQVYSKQVKTLKRAGVIVAASNAQAARLAALAILRGKPSPARRRRRSRPRSRSR
jgi:FdrA protein